VPIMLLALSLLSAGAYTASWGYDGSSDNNNKDNNINSSNSTTAGTNNANDSDDSNINNIFQRNYEVTETGDVIVDGDDEEQQQLDYEPQELHQDLDPTGRVQTDQKNLLVLLCDQLRYDTLGFVQERLGQYQNSLKVRTPNIDRLAQRSAYFSTAYCVSPTCGPSRTGLLTGTSLGRNGILGNKLVQSRYIERMKLIRQKVATLRSFEQVLADNKGYQVVRGDIFRLFFFIKLCAVLLLPSRQF